MEYQEISRCLNTFVENSRIFAAKAPEGTGIKLIADRLGKAVIEVQIVHDSKAHRQHFFTFEQMPYICTGIPPAHGTITSGVNGAVISNIFFVLDIDDPVPSEEMAMPAVARRHNAVEKIYTACNALNDVAGRTDTHQITWPVLGHILFDDFDGIVHLLVCFSNSKATDGLTGQIKLCDLFHMLHAQIGKDGTLVDTKKHLSGIDSVILMIICGQSFLAALEPAKGPVA